MRKNKKNFSKVIFDRKKTLETTGYGRVEILICLNHDVKKYIGVRNCTALEWLQYENSTELKLKLMAYDDLARQLVESTEVVTKRKLEECLGVLGTSKKQKDIVRKKACLTGFIDFVDAEIEKEKDKLAPVTYNRKVMVAKTLREWGHMNTFGDVTPLNLLDFHEYLDDGSREDVTLNNYHKVLRKVMREAHIKGLIETYPYDDYRCKFSRGKSKERNPLTEEELLSIRELNGLTGYEEHARDLFVFQAYTGLCYCDMQAFDFFTMVERHEGQYFIDGKRLKTGSTFFTPILPPALEVLEKYEYKLPRITNQKLNEYLHIIKRHAKINRPMTSHVARHSFATLMLTYGVPIENVSKMMGHTNFETTKIYAKVLKASVHRHVQELKKKLK